MKATEINLLKFLQETQQFVIPIYQRTYSWTIKQCDQLWKDIARAAIDDAVPGHFVGSIVYIEKGLYQVAAIPQLLVIDGQQRLTTFSLLLAALGNAINLNPTSPAVSQQEIRDYYLFNAHGKEDLRYKLLLTQNDKETLIRILENKETPSTESKRVVDNFRFFEERIGTMDMDLMTLFRGIQKLVIVDIALDRDHDNPQLIFESLNSTGLELSQADLVRNYVLMGLEPREQEELYKYHWFPMEQGFGQADYAVQFDRFMRDYLTVKTGRIPNIREVYDSFKVYAQTARVPTSEVVADVHKFSKYFISMALENETNRPLKEAFHDINTLKVDVAYPLLLELYDDYSESHLDHNQFVAILRLVESYVFRRAVCGIPTNTLNKTFAALSRELDKENYLESFAAALILKDSYRRFPDDEEFKRELAAKDVYSFRNRNYLLRKLENHNRKELVDIEGYTIEHIMPQNDNLSVAWQADLGENWREVQALYLHTLGNLTLTGYNSELADRSFVQKRDMEGGFADSPIRLNHHLSSLEAWNEKEIMRRAQGLAKLAISVWVRPGLSAEALATYKRVQPKASGKHYSLADHQYLKGENLRLFTLLRKHILNLDAAVREEILKLYIAYKATTNFVDVVPKREGFLLTLNMSFDEIYDPKNLCRDVSMIGKWANGDVEVKLSSPSEIQDIMALVQQSFDRQNDMIPD